MNTIKTIPDNQSELKLCRPELSDGIIHKAEIVLCGHAYIGYGKNFQDAAKEAKKVYAECKPAT